MRNSLLITFFFAFLILLSLAFTTNNDRQYKNLKVLPKNTTKAQMDTIMRHFTASLGVKCNFCHVFNSEQKSMDFVSDANKHKEVARNMMRMTKKINKKYFEFTTYEGLTGALEVTCYTCHNGKAEPASVPATASVKR